MADVVVGCKLPHGLIINQAGHKIVLAGENSSRVIGGYGMTSVDKDLMSAWMADHKGFTPVKQGLIFFQESKAKAKDEATEKAKVKSGFEGIDPEKPGPGIEAATKIKKTRQQDDD